MILLQFTGLSGAGKSTLAEKLQQDLVSRNLAATVVDGDAYRKTLCKDLGFSAADRKENTRRLAAVAAGFCREGTVSIIAAINPFEEIRREIRDHYNAFTVWVHCPLPVLLERDPKGLYQRALLPDSDPEKIFNLTGINDPYEVPTHADLVIDTSITTVDTASKQLLLFVLTNLNEHSH
ncbi:adenylyl-sulfate kinase [Flavisolibacter sp. BT320]|nr:adenylyl-sulfate kinase [Flavisolibacter longurius]